MKSISSPFALLVPHFWLSPPLSVTSFFPFSSASATQTNLVILLLHLYTSSDSLVLLKVSQLHLKFPLDSQLFPPKFRSCYLLSWVSCSGHARVSLLPEKAMIIWRQKYPPHFLSWQSPIDHFRAAQISNIKCPQRVAPFLFSSIISFIHLLTYV